jgi:predicted phosphoribosyltransferase
MFTDRNDAGHQLGLILKQLPLRNPLIVAIPCGGVATGAAMARVLRAELDVVLSRKLRSRDQPELAIGAVSEDGNVRLNEYGEEDRGGDEYLRRERECQMADIARHKEQFREVKPKASAAGRSVIVTDDGIATGSTMIAALRTVRAERPHELIVAVPVAPPDRVEQLQGLCDRVICLLSPKRFGAIGQLYQDFEQVPDTRVIELLREFRNPLDVSELPAH